MSVPSANISERRLSVNGRNAYVVITANESETGSTNKNSEKKKKIDDSLYLTAKPANRVRFFSEGSIATVEPKSNQTDSAHSTLLDTPENSAKKVQIGMDRYITVLKRGRSPNSSETASKPKIIKGSEKVNSQNRFAILANDSKEPSEAPKSFKPPPIYLRGANTNEIIKSLVALIGDNAFYVTRIKRGNLQEVKIQVNHENDYRKVVTDFESKKRNFYTYQLKSAKGLQVVIKGIDSFVTPDEIKAGLKEKGFKPKSVTNIKNKEKVPQPLFRVELEPGDMKLKKNEVHPIYELKYLLHRRITVEEPHKRTGPVQCANCQEFGHTKAYCKLPSVCVICGELHVTAECNKSKEDSKVKKCSNCGGNHTANYRGCPIFAFVRKATARKPETVNAQLKPVTSEKQITPLPVSNQFSYADILKTGQITTSNTTNMPKVAPITTHKPKPDTSEINFSRLEATIDNLVQTTNNFTTTMSHLLRDFTTSMSSMMKEMMTMQQMILQSILNKP